MHLVYPPSALPFFAPFGALDWNWSKGLWVACLAIAYLVGGATVALTIGLRRRPIPLLLAAAAILGFAPAHTGLAVGNPGMLAGSLAVAGLAASLGARRSRHLLAGLLVGVATAIKPQIGLPLCLFFAASRRWTTLSISLAVPLIFGSIVAFQLLTLNPNWPEGVSSEVASMPDLRVGAGAASQFGKLHLDTLIRFFIEGHWAKGVAIVLLVPVLVLWVRRVWRTAPGQVATDEALLMTPLLAMTLLAVYHRPYDAVILLPALAVGIAKLASRDSWRTGLLLLLPLSVFLVAPWAEILIQAAERNIIPNGVASNALFQFFVMAHPTWALLALAVIPLFLPVPSANSHPAETSRIRSEGTTAYVGPEA